MALGIALSLSLTGCSMVKKSTGDSSGGGGGGGGAPLGDTMADAVVYKRGSTFTAPAGCHTSSYAKLDIPAGEAITLELTVTSPKDESCISFWFLNQNGGDGGLSAEACSTKSPFTYQVTAQEGTSFLQISEAGVCQGSTVEVAIK
ncbi:MAG TPA: hypothetical protein VM261_06980 [Kofleriaceae bacterium]|nr:hypothetical protein [Kofleriaceae bacterium]